MLIYCQVFGLLENDVDNISLHYCYYYFELDIWLCYKQIELKNKISN